MRRERRTPLGANGATRERATRPVREGSEPVEGRAAATRPRNANGRLARAPTAENGWNGESSPVQGRAAKVVRTGRGCSAECRAEQKGAYSSQPLYVASGGVIEMCS